MGKQRVPRLNSDTPGNSGTIIDAFLENRTGIKNFLSRFLSSSCDIEDVLQETYLRARGAERQQKIVSPKAFLYRIARNEALRELSRTSRHIIDLVGTPADADDYGAASQSLEGAMIETERFGQFCESTLEMPPQCRRVFLMCKVYGYSYAEIATELGISQSAVEKHISKGLKIAHLHVRRRESSASHEQGTQLNASGNSTNGNEVRERAVWRKG